MNLQGAQHCSYHVDTLTWWLLCPYSLWWLRCPYALWWLPCPYSLWWLLCPHSRLLLSIWSLYDQIIICSLELFSISLWVRDLDKHWPHCTALLPSLPLLSGSYSTCKSNKQMQTCSKTLPARPASHTAAHRTPTSPRIFHTAGKRLSAWKHTRQLCVAVTRRAPVRRG